MWVDNRGGPGGEEDGLTPLIVAKLCIVYIRFTLSHSLSLNIELRSVRSRWIHNIKKFGLMFDSREVREPHKGQVTPCRAIARLRDGFLGVEFYTHLHAHSTLYFYACVLCIFSHLSLSRRVLKFVCSKCGTIKRCPFG